MDGDEAVRLRRKDFADRFPGWIVVRHFLSADLLAELCEAVVEEVSGGRLALADLFDTARTHGPAPLTLWAIRLRDCEGALSRVLQDVLRQLVWQTDGQSFYARSELAPDDAARFDVLVAAVEAGLVGLGSTAAAERLLMTSPEALGPVLQAVAAWEDLPDEPGDLAVEALARLLEESAGNPLASLLVKHLGDLYALADAWKAASLFYSKSAEMLSTAGEPQWSDLAAGLQAVLSQSQASAQALLGDPQGALERLNSLATGAALADNSVGLANSAVDAMALANAMPSGWARRDGRAVIATAPQILDALDEAPAYSRWMEKDYAEAHRLFMATLRRQLALGSGTYSRHTRAAFGRSLLEAFQNDLPRRERPERLTWGVQLLVEGERPDAVDLVPWDEPLAKACIEADCVATALARADSGPGARPLRQAVVAELFTQWLASLPPDDVDPAVRMLRFLYAAACGPSQPSPSQDLPERALGCLVTVARRRPEFRGLVGADVAGVILAGLGGGMLLVTKALEAALEWKDAFDEASLASLGEGIAALLERMGPPTAPWTIARPAMEFLGSKEVRSLQAWNGRMRDRVRGLLVRYALESETEHASLMFLLRDLPQEWIKHNVDEAKVQDVVVRLRHRAARINSSRAAGDIFALLVAPGFSGSQGVEDALKSVLRIIDAARAGKGSVPFPGAYRCVMLVGDAGTSLAERSGLPIARFRKLRDGLFEKILALWTAAEEEPSVFAQFSLVPMHPSIWLPCTIGRSPPLGWQRQWDGMLR